MWLRRGAVVLALIALTGFVAFNAFKTQIATGLFKQVMQQRAGIDPSADLPDGLHIYLCGTGSPMPDATRAGPCIGVLAGDRGYVFDVGSGGVRNLGTMGFPMARLQAIYLTHLHSDHIDGLGELMLQSWIGGTREVPTPIIGPVGTERVVDGFNMAYGLDSTYRIAHHGPDIAPPGGFGGVATEIVLPAGPKGKAVIFQDDDLTITAIRVAHNPVEPAFGFRIDYKDRSVSLSGDTIYHPGFVAASEGVDIMFHEALDPEMVTMIEDVLRERGQAALAKIMFDIRDYHASPEDATRAAHTANAGALVYYHIVPPLPIKLLNSIFLGDANKAYDGSITIGEDGMLFTLPAGSDKIMRSKTF